MQTNALNRAAVQALLADADGVLALTKVAEMRGTSVPEMVVNIRAGYRDLVRRSLPLIMTDGEQIAFQRKLHLLRSCLQFFGESA